MRQREVVAHKLLMLAAGLAVLSIAAVQEAAAQWVYSPPLSLFDQNMRGVGGPNGIPVAVSDGTRTWPYNNIATHYTIDMKQFTDTLHPDLPPTTLWGYNPTKGLGVNGVPTPKALGGIIIAKKGVPVQITFRDKLPNAHILPVDTTIMGADGAENRVVPHLHGGFTPWLTDGGPFAWWDPQGQKGPSFINNSVLRKGQNVPANEAEFYYPNQQTARLMWYHDHAIGITRLNAYAGLASAYILRDNYEYETLILSMGLPNYIEKGGRELPLIIQDKIFEPSFNPSFPGTAKTKGSLWYPYIYDPNRWELGPSALPLPVPSIVPEMFGENMLANGTVYPKAPVQPRRYRLRILNACQARFLNLQLYEDNGEGEPDFNKPGPDWFVIGTEGGFLARPVSVPSRQLQYTVDPDGNRTVDPAKPGGSLITAPAERWDVVVDFNGKSGKKYILYNDAPAPYPMGDALNDYPNESDQGNTEVIMRFDVGPDGPNVKPDAKFKFTEMTNLAGDFKSGIARPLAGPIPFESANKINWCQIYSVPLPIPTRPGIKVRQLTLNETFDTYGRLIQMLGTNVATGPGGDFSIPYMDPATEKPRVGTTEVWQIANLTGDVHPIHIHLVNAQLMSRRPFDVNAYMSTPVGMAAKPIYIGVARGPDPTEIGWKETFKMNPGEVTTVIMKFELPKVPFVVPPSPRTGGNEYVWHCHILEHEEHDMMRPLIVLP